MEQTEKLVSTIIKGIQEKKGQGIKVVDLKGIDGTIASYFIICQGNSPAQVEAIAESVSDTVLDWKTVSGWRSTSPTCWFMCSFLKHASFTTSTTCGKMPRLPTSPTSTKKRGS